MAADEQTRSDGFERVRLGRTGLEVCRLGVSSGYGAPAEALDRAFERGVNYIFWGSRRTNSFAAALRRLTGQRERFVLVIQSYTRAGSLMSASLERALRTLDFGHADILLLGLWNKPVPARILNAARKLKERGLARFLGVSTHKRTMVPQFAAGSDFDVIHFRYNAAHPGAEKDIFPQLPATNRPGMVAFTATSWRQLMGQAPLQIRFVLDELPRQAAADEIEELMRLDHICNEVRAGDQADAARAPPPAGECVEEALATRPQGKNTKQEQHGRAEAGGEAAAQKCESGQGQQLVGGKGERPGKDPAPALLKSEGAGTIGAPHQVGGQGDDLAVMRLGGFGPTPVRRKQMVLTHEPQNPFAWHAVAITEP